MNFLWFFLYLYVNKIILGGMLFKNYIRKQINKILADASRQTELEFGGTLDHINETEKNNSISRIIYVTYIETINKYTNNIYKELNK